MQPKSAQSPLFVIFILLGAIVLTVQISLKLINEVIKLAGAASVYLPTLSPAAVAMSMSWLGVCSAVQYWWLTYA